MSKNGKEQKAYDDGPELLFDVADKQREAKQAAEAKSEAAKAQEAAEEPGSLRPPSLSEAPRQAAEADPKQIEEAVNAAVKDQEEHTRFLAAEYDNYRKRTQQGEGSLLGRRQGRHRSKSFLPVYDNLARALQTEDGRRGLCQRAWR